MTYPNSVSKATGKTCSSSSRFSIIAMLFFTAFMIFSTVQSHAQPQLNIKIKVKAALQGMFDPSSRTHVKNCEVQLTLRDGIDPHLIHGTRILTIDRSTLTGSVTFEGLTSNEYYLSIKSPNSIETFSANPVMLSNNEENVYDFTVSKNQAYGANMFEYDFGGPKIACVFVGDVNNDEIVDGTDYLQIENDVVNYVLGNSITDLTGDEFVDGDDLIIADQNAGDYVKVMVPEGSVFSRNNNVRVEEGFILKQNYPNPFNPTTSISFSLQNSSDVKLSIFDMAGRELAVLTNSRLNAGNHSFNWNASNLSSGTYFYKLSVNGQHSVKQMQLVK